MTYDPRYATTFRQRLLQYPAELENVDYKSSIKFGEDDEFTLKLIRHIFGMANVGGVWLIIGYQQTPRQELIPDPSHSDEVTQTYEPTILTQKVNSFLERGQQIRLSVFPEPLESTGIRYPLIYVEGFARIPYICRSNKKVSDTDRSILRQGAVYVRRPSVETSIVSKPGDWEELIERCVRLRRRELLSGLQELVERTVSPRVVEQSALEALTSWMSDMKGRAFNHSDAVREATDGGR